MSIEDREWLAVHVYVWQGLTNKLVEYRLWTCSFVVMSKHEICVGVFHQTNLICLSQEITEQGLLTQY